MDKVPEEEYGDEWVNKSFSHLVRKNILREAESLVFGEKLLSSKHANRDFFFFKVTPDNETLNYILNNKE